MRSVYRDELLRYSPHRAAPQVRIRYFEEILPGLEDAVLAYLPSQGEHAGALLREAHTPLLLQPSGKPLTLLTFGDCLMTEMRVFLPEKCAEADSAGYARFLLQLADGHRRFLRQCHRRNPEK